MCSENPEIGGQMLFGKVNRVVCAAVVWSVCCQNSAYSLLTGLVQKSVSNLEVCVEIKRIQRNSTFIVQSCFVMGPRRVGCLTLDAFPD